MSSAGRPNGGYLLIVEKEIIKTVSVNGLLGNGGNYLNMENASWRGAVCIDRFGGMVTHCISVLQSQLLCITI
jgi:hypothetical protein